MTHAHASVSSQPHVFRVDSFAVPEAGRAEFLARVYETHALLQQQPGFVRDLVLEQAGGPGRFNLVTLVEWESQAVVDTARATIKAHQASIGFDPQALFARLGIEAQIGSYRRAESLAPA